MADVTHSAEMDDQQRSEPPRVALLLRGTSSRVGVIASDERRPRGPIGDMSPMSEPASTATLTRTPRDNRRALATGNPLLVRAAAAELNSISLADALSICLVLLRAEPTRYGRAAARFHARLVQDVARVELEDAQIALAALQGLRGPDPAGAGGALAELFAALELADLQQRLEAWLRVLPRS